MELRKKTVKGVPVLAISGRMIGDEEQEELHAAVRELVDRGDKKIVIDLGHVEWMSSLGLGALIACFVTIRNAGGELAVSRVRRRVRALFRVLRVCRVFCCHETIKGAIAHVQSPRSASSASSARC